jgi:uncharacterized C2H2 Zn-finger protein
MFCNTDAINVKKFLPKDGKFFLKHPVYYSSKICSCIFKTFRVYSLHVLLSHGLNAYHSETCELRHILYYNTRNS